jgi:aryl-alcohol dehydrogenase-like predicted oxidoreductase
METRKLGQTGLVAPVIGMGTWKTFDVRGAQAERVRVEIVTEALQAGANLFDSSPMYGEAERVLGQALRSRRREAIIATKVWTATFAEGKRQIARALGFFQGHVEIYQIHNLVAWREYLPLLEDMKAQGQTQAIGITHYSRAAFGELHQIMETGRVDAIQIPYNILNRAAENEILPLANDLDLGVIVMSPLGVGALVQREPPRTKWRQFEAMGITSWAQVLLKWIVSDPRVSVTIPATSRPGRMTENAAAGNPPFFDPEQREMLARLAEQYQA